MHFGPLLLLASLTVLAAGCARAASPQGWAPPELQDDALYASIEKGKMAALDPDDFSVTWVFPSGDQEDQFDLEGIYGAPVVDGDTLYFGAYDDSVYALNADDGTLRWTFKTDDPITSALALGDGTLYAGSTDGNLYAIDLAACTNSCPPSAALTFSTGSSIWASPLLVEGVVYVAAMDGRLYALDAETLEPVDGFSFKTDAGLVMDPILANDNTLLAGGIDSKFSALDRETGEEKWSFEGANWFWARPLVDESAVYAADLDGNVHALSLDDGTPLWSSPFTAEAPVRSAPLLVGDTLLVVDRAGNVYGRNPDDGTSVSGWPTNPNTSEPSVALDKTVLSDPFLFERASLPGGAEPSPGATAGAESPTATEEASPTPRAAQDTGAEVIIIAQGGDLCRLDATDGSPIATPPCVEVPL